MRVGSSLLAVRPVLTYMRRLRWYRHAGTGGKGLELIRLLKQRRRWGNKKEAACPVARWMSKRRRRESVFSRVTCACCVTRARWRVRRGRTCRPGRRREVAVAERVLADDDEEEWRVGAATTDSETETIDCGYALLAAHVLGGVARNELAEVRTGVELELFELGGSGLACASGRPRAPVRCIHTDSAEDDAEQTMPKQAPIPSSAIQATKPQFSREASTSYHTYG